MRPASNDWVDQHRIADNEQIDMVPLDVEADMLKRENGMHPGAAADALNTEALPRNCSMVFRFGFAMIVWVSLLEMEERIRK
jgi:hypothetical protein